MSKKLIIIIIIIFCSVLKVSADSRLIPKIMSSQYKTEIEQVIKTELPKTKREIDIIYKEVQTEQNPYIKRSTAEIGITSVLFDFYKNLADITNKYAETKLSLPNTDWYIVIKEQLEPYFKENSVRTKPIDKLLKYAEKKQKKIKI